MSNLIEIKKRMESIASTIKVTKVMQMIATAKIAKIKPMIVVVDRYEQSANEVLGLYLKNSTNTNEIEKFFEKTTDGKKSNNEKKQKKEQNKKVLLLMFASDKGTCGSINTNIYKFTIEKVKEYQKDNCDITILPIGKRAVKWVKSNAEKLSFKIYSQDNFVADAEYCNGEVVGKITKNIVSNFKNEEFDEIKVLYHKYKNIITCFTDELQILPISKDTIKLENIGFTNIDESENTINAMIDFFVRTKIYNSYVSNIASIVSSRMNAMDNATKNGQELIDELRIKYNKTRQASITAELSDIVSGSEALN